MKISKIISSIKLRTLRKRGLIVGDNFTIENRVRIDNGFPWLIEIGDNVTLAPDVTILSHDACTKKILGFGAIGKVIIGDNVFIGARSIILPNVKIGENCIIGAGSVVTKDIPSNSIACGNPAKVIKNMADFKNQKIDEYKNGMVIEKSIIKKIAKSKDEQIKIKDSMNNKKIYLGKINEK